MTEIAEALMKYLFVGLEIFFIVWVIENIIKGRRRINELEEKIKEIESKNTPE